MVFFGALITDILPKDFEEFKTKYKIIGLSPGTELTKEQLNFYVIFLFTSDYLISEEQAKIQEKMQKAFEDISILLGQKAMALSFVHGSISETNLDHNAVMMQYFGIEDEHKKAPHIVIITKYPLDWKNGDEIVRLSFNRLQPERIHVILAGIVDSIRNNKIPYKDNSKILRFFSEAVKKWLNDHKEDIKSGVELVSNFVPTT